MLSTLVLLGLIADVEPKIVSDAPAPVHQRFADLDSYLAWLKKTRAPIDRAWYEEVRPGLYALRPGGNLRLDGPGSAKRLFTRDELKKKFGFSR